MTSTVKKNAQAKKDTLGPNWTHWVGKAVEKLVSFVMPVEYSELHLTI